MFEKANIFAPAARARESGLESPAGRHCGEAGDAGLREGKGGKALRAIEWSELTARLDAARDLRELLRRDACHHIESSAASFGDAAARYFARLGDGEWTVNLDDLEGRKASQDILRSVHGDAAKGDAREDR